MNECTAAECEDPLRNTKIVGHDHDEHDAHVGKQVEFVDDASRDGSVARAEPRDIHRQIEKADDCDPKNKSVSNPKTTVFHDIPPSTIADRRRGLLVPVVIVGQSPGTVVNRL
jgi:hypothetical protein